MIDFYFVLKWLHILLAIAAVGSNLTYAIWIRRAEGSSQALPFTLRGIKLIDDRIANPAYVLILLTGIAMAVNADFPLTTPWIMVALILWFVMLLTGLFGYSPTLNKQIELAEQLGPDDPQYKAVAGRAMWMGIVLGLVVLVIIYLMVFQPVLWG